MRYLFLILLLIGCGSVMVIDTGEGSASSSSGSGGASVTSGMGGKMLDAGGDACATPNKPWECCGSDAPICLGPCCESVDPMTGNGHNCMGNEHGVCCALDHVCVPPKGQPDAGQDAASCVPCNVSSAVPACYQNSTCAPLGAPACGSAVEYCGTCCGADGCERANCYVTKIPGSPCSHDYECCCGSCNSDLHTCADCPDHCGSKFP